MRLKHIHNLRRGIMACALTLFGLVAASAQEGSQEKLPEGLQVVALESFPATVELTHRLDYRQLLITGQLASGEVVDLTRMARLSQTPTSVTVSSTGLVEPVQDGAEQLVYEVAGQSLNIPVKVTGAKTLRKPSFVQDVQPSFSRMGCNAGTCHGSKNGKNGFKLSLRGYDPLFDHQAFTDDVGARRINRPAPNQSLMLLKASASIPHVGGLRTKVGERYYELVREWIAQGAKLDLDAPRVVSIDVLPKNPILPRADMKQQMVVLATYADGQVRDVTREAFIESGNIEVIEADSRGLLTLLRRGEAPVLVRYEGAYAATTLIVMGDRTGFEWKSPPVTNYIDELVYKKLQRVKVLPGELCSDPEFVRRLYLDLTGLPPTVAQVRAFLTDARESQAKRQDLIDQLVGSREYVEHWTNKWADMLQVNRKFLGEEGAIALRNWIKDAVARNVPYDQLAREILTASGSTMDNPPAAYYKILRDPASLMENTTHLFLAVRFNCNKCHDHPFERWTQDQYYDLAAYFAQIGLKEDPTFAGQKIGGSAVEGANPLVEVVYDTQSGEVKHDRTGQTSSPKFPFRHEDVAGPDQSRRMQLAQWITSPKNQYFARSYVNRLWGYLLGVGIIEPIDDIRAGNPATNPELLTALEKDFIEHGFDVQHMIRTICNSRVYQHSVTTNAWNDDDELNYSHALPRRLPAEVLYDAIHVAAGSRQRIPGVPDGFRAAELPDAGIKVPFLDDFGRPVRESACECERSTSMVLGPIMKLVNGPTVADALADPTNALTTLVAQEPDDQKLVEEVFLRFLARIPNADELKLGKQALELAGGEHTEMVAALDAYRATLPARQAEWEKKLGIQPVWTNLEPQEMKSEVGAEFARQPDQAVLVSGKNGKDTYTITALTDLVGITGLRIELLPDPSLPNGGPGRAANANLVLSELKLTATSKSDPAMSLPAALQNPSADFSQEGWPVAAAIDGNDGTGWGIHPQANQPHAAVFETKTDVGFEGGTLLSIAISQQFGDGTHSIGRFRLAVTRSPRPFRLGQVPEDLAIVLAVPIEQRTPEQQEVAFKHYRLTDSQLQELEAQVQVSADQLKNKRLVGVQDLAWALINNPAFLFNR